MSGHQATRLGRPYPGECCPFQRVILWAGSPAASWPTVARPNAPPRSPNGSAASTRLRLSWERPGRRYARRLPPRAGHDGPATPTRSGSAPSPPPASAAADRPPRRWTRCLWRSTRAPSQPGNGDRPSCMSGSAARSSTPPWVPTWWSSCIAKATPASQPTTRTWAIIPATTAPTAPTGWPANAPAALSAATPTAPTAPGGPANPGAGDGDGTSHRTPTSGHPWPLGEWCGRAGWCASRH
jgi:hypothetical protein